LSTPTFANHPGPARKLRNKAARAPEKGGYGSLLIGRPSNDAFLSQDSLAKYQPPSFASRSRMHDVIFLASAMCVIMKNVGDGLPRILRPLCAYLGNTCAPRKEKSLACNAT
jgi:hypothetical protein